MRVFRTTLLMTAVSGLALCAGAAHAAEPGAPAAESVDGQVEELIVTAQKREQKALDWRVGAELGDHGYGLFEGMANVPLSDTFALRLAGRYKERDGAIENVLGGRNLGSTDTGALRLSAHWSPTARLDADLILNY